VNDVREKGVRRHPSVPPELLPPVITKVDPDADPVMSLLVSSDALSLRRSPRSPTSRCRDRFRR
jgi:hypothetical protein